MEQGYEGDISIDDIRITDGVCAADMASSEVTPKPLGDQEKTKLLKDQLERYRRLMRRRQRMRQKDKQDGS